MAERIDLFRSLNLVVFIRFILSTAVTRLTLPPIPSQGDFPCAVAKKFHSALNPKSCVIYDTTWWIGVILNVFEAEGDAEIQLMHFNDKTRTLKWLVREDKCLFPLTKILCKICAPSAITSYHRQYRLPAEELNMVEQRFKDYISK